MNFSGPPPPKGSPIGRVLKFVGYAGTWMLAISMVTSTGLRLAIKISDERRAKSAPKCSVCKGQRTQPCRLCKRSGVVSWSPFAEPVIKRPVLCPVCDGVRIHRCFNCLGKGFV